MALEATHIRFALDLQDKYRINNIEEYLTGAIYPDSRYHTKTDRILTHPKDFKTWDILQLGDFKKGWATHLLADELQFGLIQNKFPELSIFDGLEFASEAWINLTAVKVLQDLDDAKQVDLKSYFPNVNYVTAQAGENLDLLKEYYLINKQVFSQPLTLESYGWKLSQLGLTEELSELIVKKASELQENAKITKLVSEIYPEMLESVYQTL